MPAGQGSICTSDAVDDAAAVEGGIPLGMLVQRRQDHDRLFHLERRAHIAHDLPAVDLTSGHRDDHLDHIGLRALQQDEAQPPVDRHVLAGVDAPHHLLGGIAQADVGEAQGLARERRPGRWQRRSRGQR